MGRKVAVSMRIMPESVEVDVDKIKNEIEGMGLELKDIKVVPVAFGLKAIEAVFLVADEGGVVEKLEEKLKSIEGAGDVETISVTLI